MSTPGERKSEVRCPECGSANQPGVARCWLCGHSLLAPVELVQATVVPESPAGTRLPIQFRLSAMLVVVTLICIGLAMLQFAPGLGVPLLVFLVCAVIPALLRTSAATRGMSGQGPVSVGERFASFLTSLGMVLLILCAAGGAFFATCLAACGVLAVGSSAGNNSEQLFMVLVIGGLVAAGLAAAAVFAWMYYITWPKRK